MYRIALDIAQARPEQVIYIDDRPMFVEVAQEFGRFTGIIHKDYKTTKEALGIIGLSLKT